jgi:hypothetical protein
MFQEKLESTGAQVEPPKTAVPSGSWVGMSKTHLTPKQNKSCTKSYASIL